MNPDLHSLEVVLFALILVGSLFWQRRLLREDCENRFPPRRLYIPLGVSVLVLVGCLFQGMLCLADSRKPEFGLSGLLELIGKAVVVAVALNIKTFLGPVFVGYAISATLYGCFEYNEWEYWPLLDLLLDWIFDGSPRWLKYAYMAATFAYALAASVVEEWFG